MPVELTDAAFREATALIAHGVLAPCRTTRVDEANGWISSAEAPPAAPQPEQAPGPPPPPTLFGPSHDLGTHSSPALCSALRLLRGLAARLEEISELRLAVPRAGLLRQIGMGGCTPSGPLNSGWPDNGCELACTLLLGTSTTAPASVSLEAHGKKRTLSAPPGSLLLSLARQVRCAVPPAPTAEAAASRPLWLTMHMYSVHLRSSADDRMLGISMAKRRETQEQIRLGKLHGGQLTAGS